MAENETKKDKTGIYTAIIAGVVALSTGLMTNFDKITGKTASSENKTEIVKDTISFNYKLDKVIKDCPSDFANITGNIHSEDGTEKQYYSKVNFDEGITTIAFSDEETPTLQVLAYTGTDANQIQQKKLELYKKVSDFMKVKPSQQEEKTETAVMVATIFEKGNIQVGIIDIADADGNTITLAVTKK